MLNSVNNVFEQMFFQPVEELSIPLPLTLPAHHVSVCFSGTPTGSLELIVSNAQADCLTRNFLPGDNPSQSQITDVLCEVANMLCGQLLSNRPGLPAFRISAPACSEATEMTGTGWQAFLLEQEPIFLRLTC